MHSQSHDNIFPFPKIEEQFKYWCRHSLLMKTPRDITLQPAQLLALPWVLLAPRLFPPHPPSPQPPLSPRPHPPWVPAPLWWILPLSLPLQVFLPLPPLPLFPPFLLLVSPQQVPPPLHPLEENGREEWLVHCLERGDGDAGCSSCMVTHVGMSLLVLYCGYLSECLHKCVGFALTWRDV